VNTITYLKLISVVHVYSLHFSTMAVTPVSHSTVVCHLTCIKRWGEIQNPYLGERIIKWSRSRRCLWRDWTRREWVVTAKVMTCRVERAPIECRGLWDQQLWVIEEDLRFYVWEIQMSWGSSGAAPWKQPRNPGITWSLGVVFWRSIEIFYHRHIFFWDCMVGICNVKDREFSSGQRYFPILSFWSF